MRHIADFIWGAPMLALLLGTGIYFTCKTGFFQISHLRLWIRETIVSVFKDKKTVSHTKNNETVSPFQAVTTSLAATVGTGNIAGVATAVLSGGPGSVFWMWISALFGMMTGFAENTLGSKYRADGTGKNLKGTTMDYLHYGVGKKYKRLGKILAYAFSVCCIIASFGIGNTVQVNEVAGAFKSELSISPLTSAFLIAGICSVIIIGGVKRIGAFTEKAVPVMALGYIAGVSIIILKNMGSLLPVLKSIVTQAFGYDAIKGGINGTLIKAAISTGLRRGAFSNEAGLGSTVLAHSASEITEPVKQGMWSIFEVFFDSMIICTLTALAILLPGTGGAEGVALVCKAFKENGFGSFGGIFVAVSTLLFAVSTMIGWSYFGTLCIKYICGEKYVPVYKMIFIIIMAISPCIGNELIWIIADIANGMMAIPNLIGVAILSKEVIELTNKYLNENCRQKPQK